MPRALIVNADDLGLSDPVDRGIRAAHLGGIVTSTSLLVGGPSISGAPRVAAEAPALGVGLHVNLTMGRPMSWSSPENPLCGSDGTFRPGPLLLQGFARASAGELRVAVRSEVAAQIERFTDLVGRPPDHLDVHQHVVHFHPVAFEAYLSVARAHGLPVRSPEPFVDPRRLELFLDRVWRENGVLLAPLLPPPGELAAALAEVWRASGVRAPDHFVHAFYGSGATVDSLVDLIRTLPEGVSELMCHPGLASGDSGVYDSEREHELAALTDPRVSAAIDEEGIELGSYAQWMAREVR